MKWKAQDIVAMVLEVAAVQKHWTLKKKSNNSQKPGNAYAKYSNLVIQMAVIIILGVFIGIKLDEKFPNENDLYTLFSTLTAVILSMIYVINRIISASKDDK